LWPHFWELICSIACIRPELLGKLNFKSTLFVLLGLEQQLQDVKEICILSERNFKLISDQLMKIALALLAKIILEHLLMA
jgi:hypothetical protein